MSDIKKIPKIQDLYTDVAQAKMNDELMVLLNQDPLPAWVKIHPYIAGYKYLPIDKVEYLLKKIFRKYSIEILREGTAFNGVYVVVRVNYLNPVTGQMDYHDGIGAKELQVKKGSSAADLANINSGALAMAFPIAKTVAIKDACDHFGRLFGSDLNRKDTMSISIDDKLQDKPSNPIDGINTQVAAEKPATASAGHPFEEITDEAKDMTVHHAEHVGHEPAPAPMPAPAPVDAPPAPPVAEYDDF